MTHVRTGFLIFSPYASNGATPLLLLLIHSEGASGDSEYEKKRATVIADEWGFIGFAMEADVTADSVTGLIDASIAAISAMDNVDPSSVAIFGYGSPAILTYAVEGHGTDTVKALVSFHADISGDLWIPTELKKVGPKLLVLSGGEEFETIKIMELEQTLDAANATWEITRYSNAGASFTDMDSGTSSQTEATLISSNISCFNHITSL